MQRVYFISGLGANRRTFSLLNLSFCEPIFLDWLQPEKGEPLSHYAKRLMNGIADKEPIIVGLSFGGMLATEMAKLNSKARVIIVSSNKTSLEFPFYLRIGKYLPLYKLGGGGIQKSSKNLFGWIIGPRGEPCKKLLEEIRLESDPNLTAAFIDMILRWNNKTVPPNVTHIHGTGDLLLPYKRVKADYTITSGTHLMIMNNAEELSLLLQKLICSSKKTKQ